MEELEIFFSFLKNKFQKKKFLFWFKKKIKNAITYLYGLFKSFLIVPKEKEKKRLAKKDDKNRGDDNSSSVNPFHRKQLSEEENK